MKLSIAIIGVLVLVQFSTQLCKFSSHVTECENFTLQQIESLASSDYKEHISINNSEIPRIPSLTFSYFTRIQQLSITGSKIHKLEENAFLHLSMLEELNLYNNQIRELVNDVFNGLGNLKKLNLGLNKIDRIEERAFNGLSSLIELNLNYNYLGEITSSLKQLTTLKTLHLSSNQVKRLNSEVLPNLTNLLYLNLEGNCLFAISHGGFYGLQNLEELNIRSNGLINLDVESIAANLPSLKSIEISMNNFKCDKLQSIITSFRDKKITVVEGFSKSPTSVNRISCKT